MNEIIDTIKKLSYRTKYIKLYQNYDIKIIMKNIGKITVEVDKEYTEFLKYTNGASILDYCFLGLKNRELGVNLYENITELWQMDNMLTFKFWGIAGTSGGENFGYLDLKNKEGNHFIGYYSPDNLEQVYLAASSFKIFMKKCLKQIEITLELDKEAIYTVDNNWFMDINKLIENDNELKQYITDHDNSTKYNLFEI